MEEADSSSDSQNIKVLLMDGEVMNVVSRLLLGVFIVTSYAN